MSYLEFYNLKEQPFSISVDNRFYYNSAQHAEALIRLKYAAEERKGFAILVGHLGTGKTTLARRMLDELDEAHYESALLIVIHGSVTSEWLLRKIAMQLGVEKPAEGKTEILTQLYNRLVEIYDKGKKAVVLIDEAQMLQNKEVMEEIRGIMNIELDGHKLITFIFFGLTDLDKYLALDEPLKQRIAVRYELRSFAQNATEEYIKFRLQKAGAKRELFTKDALNAIHEYTDGVPRLINTLCDNALLEGFLRKQDDIDAETIHEVASDLKMTAK
jgi:general secretion pathway protein A